MDRWVEHYSDLYSRENTVSPAALDVIECLSTMDELDSEPSEEELLRKAIGSLASGKAPVNDAQSPFPVLTRRSCTTAHEGLQYHYPIQEQEREERL